MSGLLLLSYFALWVLVAVEAVAIFALYQHFGQMYLSSRDGRASQGPALGTNLKQMAAHDIYGQELSLPAIEAPSLILFASTTCSLCRKLLPDLDALVRTRSDFKALVVCAGNRDAVRSWAKGIDEGLAVIPDPGYAIAARYGVAFTPFCVACDEHGIVRAKGLVNDVGGLLGAMREAQSGDFAPNIIEAAT
jgi:hypothetical protein